MVDRQELRADRLRPVHVEQVAPDRRGRGRCRPERLDDLQRRLRPQAAEGDVQPVERIGRRSSVRLEDRIDLRTAAEAKIGRIGEQPVLPPARVSLVHARRDRLDGVVDGRKQRQRLVGLDQPDPADQAHAWTKLALGPWDLQLERERGQPVAVAAVDRLLGGPQHRKRLAALVDAVELGAHHRPQDPAAPVRRQDADDRHPGRRQNRPGHGQPEREGARAAHDRVAVEGGVHAAELEGVQPALGPDVVGLLPAEVVDDRPGRSLQLVPRAAYPHVDGHAIFSSGAYSSISRRSAPSSAKRTVTTPPGSIRTTTPSPSVPWRTESPVASSGKCSRGWTGAP